MRLVVTWCCFAISIIFSKRAWWQVMIGFQKGFHVILSVGGLISVSFILFDSHNDTDYEWYINVLRNLDTEALYFIFQLIWNNDNRKTTKIFSTYKNILMNLMVLNRSNIKLYARIISHSFWAWLTTFHGTRRVNEIPFYDFSQAFCKFDFIRSL